MNVCNCTIGVNNPSACNGCSNHNPAIHQYGSYQNLYDTIGFQPVLQDTGPYNPWTSDKIIELDETITQLRRLDAAKCHTQ